MGTAYVRYDSEFRDKINVRLSKITQFHSRISKLESLRSAAIAEANISGKGPQEYENWINGQMRDALDSPDIEIESSEDGAALVALAKTFKSQDIFTKILPVVKTNIDYTPLVVAFLTGLFNAGTSGEIEKEVTRNFFRDVISDLAEQFSLQSLEKERENKNKLAKIFEGDYYSFGPGPRRPKILRPEPDDQNSRNIATLLCNCQELDLPTELGQICDKLATEVKSVEVDLFEVIYLPFLKHLSGMLQDNNLPQEISSLFQTVLATYILRFVEAEPKRPNHWARDGATDSSCAGSCADHGLLNAFLKDPKRKTERFSMAKKRRDHLYWSFRNMKGVTTETDTSRSPHTLVVTKTHELFNDAHKAWQDRCMIARNHIKDIGQDSKLSALLGDKKDAITLLAFENLSVMYPDALAQTQPLASSSSNGNRALAPTKKPRKTPSSVPASAEVIELD